MSKRYKIFGFNWLIVVPRTLRPIIRGKRLLTPSDNKDKTFKLYRDYYGVWNKISSYPRCYDVYRVRIVNGNDVISAFEDNGISCLNNINFDDIEEISDNIPIPYDSIDKITDFDKLNIYMNAFRIDWVNLCDILNIKALNNSTKNDLKKTSIAECEVKSVFLQSEFPTILYVATNANHNIGDNIYPNECFENKAFFSYDELKKSIDEVSFEGDIFEVYLNDILNSDPNKKSVCLRERIFGVDEFIIEEDPNDVNDDNKR